MDYDPPNRLGAAVCILGLVCFGFGLANHDKAMSGIGSLAVGLVLLLKVLTVVKDGSIILGGGDDSPTPPRRRFRAEEPGAFWLGTVFLSILCLVFCAFGCVQLVLSNNSVDVTR